MPRFTFDVKAFLTVRVNAPDEDTARRWIDALDGNEATLGSWPDGSPAVAGVGFDGEHDLVSDADAGPTCPECEHGPMHQDDHVWICDNCGYETSEPQEEDAHD